MRSPSAQMTATSPRPQTHSSAHLTGHSHPKPRPTSKQSKSYITPSTSTNSYVPNQQDYLSYASPGGRASNHAPETSKASSPNYFGLAVDTSNNSATSSHMVKNQRTSGSSSVTSFAAAISTQIPIDANPAFEAFKRQVDINKSGQGGFPTSGFGQSQLQPPAASRPRPSRWHTHGSDMSMVGGFPRPSPAPRERPTSKMDLDWESHGDPMQTSFDSQHSFEKSPPAKQTGGVQGFDFPLTMPPPPERRTVISKAEDRDPRLSMMENKLDPPSPPKRDISRASTLPTSTEDGLPAMVSGARLEELMDTLEEDRLLILDIRSSQNFAQSRIGGALNLCIPTTLLKRATFNIHKLQQTFQTGSASSKFSRWQEMEWIVVYDAHSSDPRDAVTAQNMVKKFTNEGFNMARTCILKGGFSVFQDQYPDFVDDRSLSELAGNSQQNNSIGVGLAPVIGGVQLPNGQSQLNPFFSNIRQNMDLADGVGQLAVAQPDGIDSNAVPTWLREAAEEKDHGKQVSDKFLGIEQDEQSRMRQAYAAFNPRNAQDSARITLCGVEKGGKNRYKDILPFEQTRVKLGEKARGDCDYVNANHITASRSHKRYIATQGPLPTTYDDFWSVIWEQDVRVIVMLTAETEGGQLKCHPYWKGKEFGPIRLRTLSEKKTSLDLDKQRSALKVDPTATPTGAVRNTRQRANTATDSSGAFDPPPQSSDAPFVVVRKFALSHGAHPFAPIREITHLHFSAWPDFGTPAQPSHLLALVELANAMQRAALPAEVQPVTRSAAGGSGGDSSPSAWCEEPESEAQARPMLVHCSAGCGRTGTFCTVDSVLDMLKRQRAAAAHQSQPQSQQQKSGHRQRRDDEGDVSMSDARQSTQSPRSSSRQQSFQWNSSPRPSKGGRQSSASSPSTPRIDISWVASDQTDLIHKTVEDFREQRLSMVQSLRQYVLCYETVLEWVHRMQEGGGVDGGRGASLGRGRSGSVVQSRR